MEGLEKDYIDSKVKEKYGNIISRISDLKVFFGISFKQLTKNLDSRMDTIQSDVKDFRIEARNKLGELYKMRDADREDIINLKNDVGKNSKDIQNFYNNIKNHKEEEKSENKEKNKIMQNLILEIQKIKSNQAGTNKILYVIGTGVLALIFKLLYSFITSL